MNVEPRLTQPGPICFLNEKKLCLFAIFTLTRDEFHELTSIWSTFVSLARPNHLLLADSWSRRTQELLLLKFLLRTSLNTALEFCFHQSKVNLEKKFNFQHKNNFFQDCNTYFMVELILRYNPFKCNTHRKNFRKKTLRHEFSKVSRL